MNEKRRPKRGGVNDPAACLTATALTVLALGIAVSMNHPACTKGQCLRTPAEQRAKLPAPPKPVVLYRHGIPQPQDDYAETLRMELAMICEVKACYRDRDGTIRVKNSKL